MGVCSYWLIGSGFSFLSDKDQGVVVKEGIRFLVVFVFGRFFVFGFLYQERGSRVFVLDRRSLAYQWGLYGGEFCVFVGNVLILEGGFFLNMRFDVSIFEDF